FPVQGLCVGQDNGAILLTPLLTGGHRLGEDVGGCGGLLVDDVRVDAEGDGGGGVAEAGRDDVHGGAGHQEGGGVDVAEGVQAGVRGGVPAGSACCGRQ